LTPKWIHVSNNNSQTILRNGGARAFEIEMDREMPKSVLAYLRDSIEQVPFHQWLQPHVDGFDEETGTVTISLAVRPEFRRDPDHPSVHGGLVAALIDIAGHAAAAASLRRGAPTIDLRVDYVRLASGPTLLATAQPIKIGRSIGLVDVRVSDDQGALVATGRCVFSTQDRS
jgi:uncharacterized protein (TIGR00369 family)